MSTISFQLHKSSTVVCEMKENRFHLRDPTSKGLEILASTNGIFLSLAQLTKRLGEFLKKGDGRKWSGAVKHDAKFAVQAFYVSVHHRTFAMPGFIQREDFKKIYGENPLFCFVNDDAKLEELVKCHNFMVAALKFFSPKKEHFMFVAELLSSEKLSFETGGGGSTESVRQRAAIYERVSGTKPATSTKFTKTPRPVKGAGASAQPRTPRSAKRPRSGSSTDESDGMSEISAADGHKRPRGSLSSVYSKEELEFSPHVFDDEEGGVEQGRSVPAALDLLLDDETTLPSDESVSDEAFDEDMDMSWLDSSD